MIAPVLNISPDIQVNSYTANRQLVPSVATLADGGWVVSWQSDGQDGDRGGIYLQRYDAAGVAVGGEVQVNTTTAGSQGTPSITALVDGGFVVSWHSDGQDGSGYGIYAQRYDAAGVAVGGEVQVNTYTAGFQSHPSITALVDGGFVVSWQSNGQDGSSYGTYLQRYDAAGVAVGGEVQVNTYTAGSQFAPSIAALVDGGFVVSWQSNGQDGSSYGTYLQRYDAAGVAVGGEVQVNSHTLGYQGFPSIAALPSGGFVVSWASSGHQDGSSYGIYLQRYDAAGVAVGGEVQVNTYTAGYQGIPSIAALVGGGFVVSWMSDGQDGDGGGVYLQRYDAAGVAVGGEVQVNTTTAGHQGNPSIAALPSGGFVVSWMSQGQDGDNYGVFQKVFNADGSEWSDAVDAVYVENAPAVAVEPWLTVMDVDSADLAGAAITVTDYVAGEDVLSFADQGGIAGSWDAATGTLTLTGVATLAAYETALRSVAYANTSDAPTGGNRTIAFQVDDGGATDNLSTPVNAQVTIVPVNDAPVVSMPSVDDVQVNSYTASFQLYPSVATLADGGWVVSWMSSGQDGDWGGIYLQRYDAAGVAVGGEVQVNTTTAGRQGTPSITALVDGGFVVSWQSDGQDGSGFGIYAQRYDAAGVAVGGEVQVNSHTSGDQGSPSITALVDGGFVVSWMSDGQDGSGFGIYAQRYDAAGVAVGGEVQVNSHTSGYQSHPSITALLDGGFVVSWESDGQDGDWFGVYLQRYDAAGVAVGGEVQVNTYTAGFQGIPSVTALVDGGFVVSWQSNGQDGDWGGVYLQRYDAAGVAVGGEVQVNSHTADFQGNPSITALPSGGFVVSWQSNGQDGDGGGVYLQRYDAAGVAVGGEVQVNTYTAGHQGNPSIAALPSGGFVVSWMSDGQDGSIYGVFQKVFNADGSEWSDAVYMENAPAVAVAPGLAVTDVDSADLAGATITVTDYVAGEDVLSFADQGGITGSWDAATGTLTLTGVATLAAYETALRSVAYANTSDAPTGGNRTIAFQVDDGGATDNLSTPVNAQVTIVPVNDAPVVSIPSVDDVQVNSYTASFPVRPSVATLADGGWVVSWQSYGQDGDGDGVYLQRYDAAGVAVGGEVQVNTYTAGFQGTPFITALPSGGFVVSWVSSGQDGSSFGIYAQRYDAAGVAVGGEVQVNSHTLGFQGFPSIAALPSGGFVVSWASSGHQDGSSYGIYLQRYDAAGVAVGGEVQVNTYTAGYQGIPSIAALVDGGFVVSWMSDGQDGDSGGIYLQRYDAAGVAVGGEVQVNTYTAGYQTNPSIAALPSGGFVVSWVSDGQDGSGYGIYVQRYDAAGVAVGGEVQVNSHTAGLQDRPSTTALVDGGFVVSWVSDGQDGSGYGIYAQRYDAAGVAVGGEVQVNSHTAGHQGNPSIAALPSGGFVVSWQSAGQDGDSRGIFQKVFNADGSEWSDAVYVENAPAVAVAPWLAVTDVDSADLAGATITVTDYVAGEDVLSFADQGGIAGSWDAATGTLTLTGVATLGAYETALRSVVYANTSDAPTGGNRTIAFQVDDGGATDNLSTPVNAQVTIVAVADPGEIVGAPGVNDVLNATADHDMFIFKPGFGHDTVTGFQSGAGTDDVIQLENMGYTDLAGVLADTQQVGADAVITVDASNSITLAGINVANLHDDDFRYFV